MTTQQMIEALSKSKNEIVARKCQRILNEETTIEAELKWSGSFLFCVLSGDYVLAIKYADKENRKALLDVQRNYNFQEKSSDEHYIIGINEQHNQNECIGLIDSNNNAKEKFNFTKQELIYAIQEAYRHGQDDEDYTVKDSIYEILKYLSQNEFVK
jgi:hypothetical protein